MQFDLIREAVKVRMKELEEGLDSSVPDWWNPHDFQSGYVTGVANSAKDELQWLQIILSLMDQK